MQLLPQGGSGTVQASSDAAKRTKSAEKTRCQACLPLLTDGSNVAAGDFRDCVSPVPLRHFYAISAWGCVGK